MLRLGECWGWAGGGSVGGRPGRGRGGGAPVKDDLNFEAQKDENRSDGDPAALPGDGDGAPGAGVFRAERLLLLLRDLPASGSGKLKRASADKPASTVAC